MTEVNTKKFYQFLAQYQSEGGWANVADSQHGNGDGTVIKSEFRKFMNAEWNGEENGELTNDLINSFWKKIDTNTSASKIKGTKLKNLNALDKTEVANLDKQLEVYVKFDEFISNNVKIPNVLTSTGSQWKTDVKDQLGKILDNYINGGASGDLDALLAEAYPQIANKCTAQYCAVEYQNSLMNSVLKDYPDYRVADDATLQSLITAYISTIDTESEPKTIKSDIQEIMKSYLETAGIGDGGSYDLSTLGYTQNDNSELNGIQQSVVRTTLLNTLNAGKASDSLATSYPEYYDKAIEDFISTKLNGAKFKDIDSLKALTVEDFKASKSYKTITALSNFDNQYANATTANDWENGVFHQAVAEAVGNKKNDDNTSYISTDLSKSLVENWKDIPAMKEILTAVKQGIVDGTYIDNNGNLKSDEIKNFIIKNIQSNLANILSQVYDGSSNGNLTPDAIKNIYNTQITAADKIEDDDKRLEQYKNAAITYCKSMSERSEGYKKELEGFEDRINNAQSVMAVKNIMKEAFEKIDAIKETEEKKIAEAKTEAENAKNKEKILESLNLKENKNEVQKCITDTIKPGYSDVTFYVNDKGEIIFVNYTAKGGAFDDDKDAALQEKFNKLKTQLETTYKSVIDTLKLSENEKKNLFNIALYLTLSDTTVVRSMYESQNVANIMDSVLDNYTKLLSKAGSDENTKDYIKNYPAGSILSGTSTYTANENLTDQNLKKTLNKYYIDDSTAGGDDWVSISSRGSETYTDGQYSGAIITLTSDSEGDNKPINNAMKSMLKDYIVSYSKYIDGNKIIELFRKAQETAFANLESTINKNEPSGSSIYGYGETKKGSKQNYDTYSGKYYGANSILINVAYEMEKLIAREMTGQN